MTKTTLNGWILNITDWTYHGFMIAFLWSVNHYYAVGIVGMAVLRYAAEFQYRKSLYQELMDNRQKLQNISIVNDLENPGKPLTQDEVDELFIQSVEEMDLPEIKQPDDKKVH